jgi:hypothetical protein
LILKADLLYAFNKHDQNTLKRKNKLEPRLHAVEGSNDAYENTPLGSRFLFLYSNDLNDIVMMGKFEEFRIRGLYIRRGRHNQSSICLAIDFWMFGVL